MPAPSTAGRRTVSRDQVIDAAVEILDAEGLDGLTMANVAKRVGFTTMAVYRHVKNREELIASAVEVVLGEITIEHDGERSWLDAVVGWMNDVRAALLAHRWAATQLGTRHGGSGVPWSKTIQILGHHIDRSPLSAHDQARALVWTTRLTVGVLILELNSPSARRTPAPRHPQSGGRRAGEVERRRPLGRHGRADASVPVVDVLRAAEPADEVGDPWSSTAPSACERGRCARGQISERRGLVARIDRHPIGDPTDSSTDSSQCDRSAQGPRRGLPGSHLRRVRCC